MTLLGEHHPNGRRAIDTLKAAIAVVLVGGSAAFTAGKLSAKAVDDRLTMHIMAESIQAERTERAATQAAYDATVSRVNTEVLLKYLGAPIPALPAKPSIIAGDGGTDSGR